MDRPHPLDTANGANTAGRATAMARPRGDPHRARHRTAHLRHVETVRRQLPRGRQRRRADRNTALRADRTPNTGSPPRSAAVSARPAYTLRCPTTRSRTGSTRLLAATRPAHPRLPQPAYLRRPEFPQAAQNSDETRFTSADWFPLHRCGGDAMLHHHTLSPVILRAWSEPKVLFESAPAATAEAVSKSEPNTAPTDLDTDRSN